MKVKDLILWGKLTYTSNKDYFKERLEDMLTAWAKPIEGQNLFRIGILDLDYDVMDEENFKNPNRYTLGEIKDFFSENFDDWIECVSSFNIERIREFVCTDEILESDIEDLMIDEFWHGNCERYLDESCWTQLCKQNVCVSSGGLK